MGTTCTGARMPEEQVLVASLSVVGHSMLSSDELFIELLHHLALVILTNSAWRKLL